MVPGVAMKSEEFDEMCAVNAADALGKLCDACVALQAAGFILPALALCYSAIDVISSLDRADTKTDATKQDFLRWVDAYLLPHPDVPCRAIDLYAARCGMLHACSAESNLSRSQQAKQLSYVDDPSAIEHFRGKVTELSKIELPHILSTLSLAHAIAGAIRKYLQAVSTAGSARTRFLANSKCVFGAVIHNPAANGESPNVA